MLTEDMVIGGDIVQAHRVMEQHNIQAQIIRESEETLKAELERFTPEYWDRIAIAQTRIGNIATKKECFYLVSNN